MSTDEICKKYMFQKSDDLSKYISVNANKTATQNDMKQIIENLIDHKNYLIKKVFNYNGSSATKNKNTLSCTYSTYCIESL